MVPRLAIYGATSTALAAAVIGSALHSRANFFAAAVTVGKSSGSLMVLANFALFNVICFGILLKKIFFGQLRPIEYEHLFERLWLFLTESLLALTIFRDDFSAPFAIMYSLLLFLKCFHWITADRVDYMDQVPAPGPPRIFHVRITSILFLLSLIDILLVTYSLESIAFNGVSSMVLFASEFVILLASVSGTFARYWIGVADLWRARGREDAPSWEQKSMYLFYVDLAVDFVKLLTYLSFFTVILLHYGLPLHILRDVYMTFRSFLSRCSDLVRYRRATRDMDAMYPNATPQDMATLGDHTCIICREEMVPQGQEGAPTQGDGPNETPKKLACGHIFHFHCLRSWLERQQSCPTCRRDVLRAPTAAATARRTPAPNVPPPAAPAQRPPLRRDATAAEIEEEIRLSRAEAEAAYEALLRPAAPGFGAGPSAMPAMTSTEPPDPETDRVQTGIWGGPITPGEFFPARLGAGPTGAFRAPRPSNSPFVRPTPTRTTSTPTPTGPSSTGLNRSPAYAAVRTQGTMTAESRQGSSRSLAPDGWTTPHSSNPPQVFSSTGSPRSSAEIPRELDDVAPVASQPGAGGPGEDAEQAAEEPEKRQRRAAAEAAMRRLGLMGSLSTSQSPPPAPGKSTDTTAADVSFSGSGASSSSAIPAIVTPTLDVKGKGKAVDLDVDEPETSRPETLADPPRVMPYLTSGLPGPHPQSNGVEGAVRNFREIAAGVGLRRDWYAHDASRGLDERMKVLRDFDEALWGLMADLTSVKSRWEVEDRQRGGTGEESEDADTQHLA